MKKQKLIVYSLIWLLFCLTSKFVLAINNSNTDYLKTALELSLKLPIKERDLIYSALGRGYFELEDYQQAALFANKISTPENKGIILVALAKEAAQKGKKDQAKAGLNSVVALAKSFASPETMAEVMAEVVTVYLILNEPKQALATLKQAEKFLEEYQKSNQITFQTSKIKAKVIFSGLYVKLGRFEAASTIAMKLDQASADLVWAEIFKVLLSSKQEATAITVMKKVNDRFIKVDLLVDLAWRYLNEKQLQKADGVIKEALQITRKINGAGKGASLAKLGRLYVKLNQQGTGLAILKQALQNSNQAKAYYPSEFDQDYQKIALTYAQLGYIERAWKTALLVEEKLEKVETLLEIYRIGSNSKQKNPSTLEVLKLACEVVPAMKYGQEAANYQIAVVMAETKLFQEAATIGAKADSLNRALIFVAIGVAQIKERTKH